MLNDNEILERYEKLALWQANKTGRKFQSLPQADIAQEARKALLLNMRGKEITPTTPAYICKCVYGAILSMAYYSDFVVLPRDYWNRKKELEAAYDRLSKIHTDITVELLHADTGHLRATCAVFLELHEADDNFFRVKDEYMQTIHGKVEKAISEDAVDYQDRTKFEVDEILSKLDPTDVAILRDIYGIDTEELDMVGTAKKLGISRQRLYVKLNNILTHAGFIAKK